MVFRAPALLCEAGTARAARGKGARTLFAAAEQILGRRVLWSHRRHAASACFALCAEGAFRYGCDYRWRPGCWIRNAGIRIARAARAVRQHPFLCWMARPGGGCFVAADVFWIWNVPLVSIGCLNEGLNQGTYLC